MLLWRSPTGVIAHASDGREVADATATIEVPPRLNLILLLEGTLDFSLGGRRFHLGPVPPSGAAQCLAVVTTRAEVLSRPLRRGRFLRKVSVAVEGGWLARRLSDLGDTDAGAASDALSRHLCSVCWDADRATGERAEAMLGNLHSDALSRRLQLESRALALITLALERLQQPGSRETAGPSSPGRRDPGRLNRALAFVERAREALWRNEVTVGEAAYLAGYRHVSNFVAAYRRMFGCTPGADAGACASR